MKVLAKYHSPLYVEALVPNTEDFTFKTALGPYNNNWTKLEPKIFVSETYFDLAGLAMDEETIFPDAITVQRGQVGGMADGRPGDSYLVYDIMTSIPVDITTAYVGWALFGAGFPGTTLNWEHVLYNRLQRYTLDIDTGQVFLMKADEAQSGSMMPTASDRVYSYRMVIIQPGPGTSTLSEVTTSPVRHVMQVTAKEEPTYEYMMRLKRSYDLQQTPDVD